MERSTPQLDETLAELADSGKRLLNTRLTELSHLDSKETDAFRRTWVTIEPKRRRQIIERLVELAEDNLELNFDSIFKYCLKDPDPDVRSKAIEGLWESESVSLIGPLISLLERDKSEKVQSTAAATLGRFAMLAEFGRLRAGYASKVEAALLAAIDDKSKPAEVRGRALEAAAPLSSDQVKTAIMAAYDSNDSRLRVSSIYAMGKSCDPAWMPILLRELANVDAEVRYEAAEACGEMENEEAVPCLVKLVHDPDVDVQIAAIQSLGNIGSTKAKDSLKRCLDDTSEVIRETAKQVLDDLKAADPLSFLH